MSKVFRCSKCVMMSTRPRLEFDSNGVCSACNWEEEKKKIDWKLRKKKLIQLLNKHKKKSKNKDFKLSCSL